MDSKFPYEFKTFLGKGAYGEVYLVELKTNPDKKFALKKIPKQKIETNSSQQKNLYNEIHVMQTLIKINNPNVVHLEAVLQSKEHYYIVMEYCNEGDLELHLKNNKNLSEEDSVELLRQLMNGFKAMHEISVVHRDIKPQNIFINDGVFKLGDFGFSRQAQGGIVEASSIYGTPAFMAPELLEEEIKVYTSKVDIWSLGVLMFFVMFKKYPFDLSGKAQLIPLFMFKVKGLYPKFDFVPALQGLNEFLKQQKQQDNLSNEFADLFQKMFQPLPENRISFIELYKHPLFTKDESQEQEVTQNFGEDLGLVSKGLKALNQSTIRKTSQFQKQKEEAEKLYPTLEKKEQEQLIKLKQGVIQAKASQQQTITGISGNFFQFHKNMQGQFIEISEQIPQGVKTHTQENMQQLLQLQQNYMQTKNIIMFLRFVGSELISVSAKIKELYSSSTIYTVLSYLYLKMRKMTEQIEKKENIYKSPLFNDFLQSIYYGRVLKQYKDDLTEIERIKNIITLKVKQNLQQEIFNQINNAKEPSEFSESFILKLIQFSTNIKDKYVNNKFQINPALHNAQDLKLQALKLGFYIACAGMVDQPELWGIIAQEAKGQPEVIKYLGASKDDQTLIQDIGKACEIARKLVKK